MKYNTVRHIPEMTSDDSFNLREARFNLPTCKRNAVNKIQLVTINPSIVKHEENVHHSFVDPEIPMYFRNCQSCLESYTIQLTCIWLLVQHASYTRKTKQNRNKIIVILFSFISIKENVHQLKNLLRNTKCHQLVRKNAVKRLEHWAAEP